MNIQKSTGICVITVTFITGIAQRGLQGRNIAMTASRTIPPQYWRVKEHKVCPAHNKVWTGKIWINETILPTHTF